MVHLCNICGGEGDDHEATCPRRAIKQIWDLLIKVTFKCPACRDGTTSLNSSDFIECKECNTQFTTGAIHDGGRYRLLGDTLVMELPEKGGGDFPLLERMLELQKKADKLIKC
jgi:ribosomal protein L37AE/L43A